MCYYAYQVSNAFDYFDWSSIGFHDIPTCAPWILMLGQCSKIHLHQNWSRFPLSGWSTWLPGCTRNTSGTPLKIKMEPKMHPIEKENHLPNLHVWIQSDNFPECKFWGTKRGVKLEALYFLGRQWSTYMSHSANGPWKKKFELYFPY